MDDADVDVGGDADAEADTDTDAYTCADADSLPLHGIPIPPQPCEIGNRDRPKRGVPEEVIQCVPDQQVLVNIIASTKHSRLVLYGINTYTVIRPLLRK